MQWERERIRKNRQWENKRNILHRVQKTNDDCFVCIGETYSLKLYFKNGAISIHIDALRDYYTK